MNLTDEEIGLITQWNSLSKAFVEAKEKREKDPKGYEKAKAEMSAFRTHWRGIREAVGSGATAGTASPSSTKATATTKGRSK